MQYTIKKIKNIICIVLVLSIFLSTYVFADDADEENLNPAELETLVVESGTKPTNEPNLNAKSAVIYDSITKQIIWGKNENDRRAMASTTKIMTAIVVIENSNPSDVVTISKKAAATGGSRLKIKAGDKITVNDLLYGLMLRSGNDAAVALAEHVSGNLTVFADLMNEKAKDLGLKNTHFITPHGLDNSLHYTTAYELALLTDYALSNDTFAKIVNTKSTTININTSSRTINNTNELLGYINGVNGVKTGFTNNAGRCLVTSCARNNNKIITVVLGCDTKKQRTSDSINLIEYAFQNYKKVNLEELVQKEFENWKKINLERVYINKAKSHAICVSLNEIVKKQITIKNEEEKDILIETNAIYNFEAPLKKGTKIGNIIVKNKDEIIETIDIVCSSTIEKKDVFSYFKELISVIPNWKQFSSNR